MKRIPGSVKPFVLVMVLVAGLGPVDVAGTFDVPINRAGSLVFLRD